MTLLLLSLPAFASPDVRWLSTDRVAIGIAEDGSLGNSEADLGLLFDPDGPKGPMPVGGDVLAVGRVFEVWSLSATVDGQPWTRVQAAPDGGSDLVLDPGWDVTLNDYETWQGVGADEDVTVYLWHALPWGSPAAWTRLLILADVDLQDLRVTRVFDPDLDHWATGSSSTINAVGEGVVVASGAYDGRAWALAASHKDELAGEGGICDGCTTAEGVLAGLRESEGDDELGLTVAVGDLKAGSSTSLIFAYGFGADADAAVAAAQVEALQDPYEDVPSLDGGTPWTGAQDTGLGPAPDPDEVFGEDQPSPVEKPAVSRGCATPTGGSLLLALPALLAPLARRRR